MSDPTPARYDSPDPAQGDQGFTRRLLVALGLLLLAVGMAVLVWRVSHVLLLVFAGVLGAVSLDGLARLSQCYLHIRRGWAVALAVLVLVLGITGFVLAVGPQLAAQSAQLAELLPQSMAQVRDWLQSQQSQPWADLLGYTVSEELAPSAIDLLGQISGIFSTTLGSLVSVTLILVLSLYLVISPRTYIDGALHLLPGTRRQRAGEVIDALGRALRWWLVGRAASMTAVGLLTGIGLWLADIPAALALAVLAGVLSFVPYIGPIAAAVPALLVAMPGWPWAPIWVLAIYAAVQFIEGNLITPFVQERAIALPPVVLLTSQLASGLLFGIFGVLLATPLTVAFMVLVQMLYVQDVLGEPIRVLGEHRGSEPGNG